MYILELRRGYPFETRVCSGKSGLLSRYNGQFGKLNYAWQQNTDASGGEPGGQAALISWHSFIGIPINFHEESASSHFEALNAAQLSKSSHKMNRCMNPCGEPGEIPRCPPQLDRFLASIDTSRGTRIQCYKR